MNKNNNPFDIAQKELDDAETPYSNTELTKVSAIAEAIKHLQDFKHIFAITDLDAQTIVNFSKAGAIANFWDIPEINKILSDLAILRLSKDRASRKELGAVLIGMSGKKAEGKKIRISTEGD